MSFISRDRERERERESKAEAEHRLIASSPNLPAFSLRFFPPLAFVCNPSHPHGSFSFTLGGVFLSTLCAFYLSSNTLNV